MNLIRVTSVPSTFSDVKKTYYFRFPESIQSWGFRFATDIFGHITLSHSQMVEFGLPYVYINGSAENSLTYNIYGIIDIDTEFANMDGTKSVVDTTYDHTGLTDEEIEMADFNIEEYSMSEIMTQYTAGDTGTQGNIFMSISDVEGENGLYKLEFTDAFMNLLEYKGIETSREDFHWIDPNMELYYDDEEPEPGPSPEPTPTPEPVIKSNYSLIADSIRAKTGKSAKMTVAQMPSEIESIETGESSTVLRVPFIVSERIYRQKFPKLIIDTNKKWLRALKPNYEGWSPGYQEYDFQIDNWVYDSNHEQVKIDGLDIHFDFRENNDSLELAINHADGLEDVSMAQFNFVSTLEDDYITEFESLKYSGTKPEAILDFFTITEDNGIYTIEQNENYNIGLDQAQEGCYSMHADEELISVKEIENSGE